MATKIKLYNPGNSPVVYTVPGNSLGGNERVEVDALDKVGTRVVAKGWVIDETPADPGDAPDEAAPAKAAPAKGRKAASDSGESAGSDSV
jgi:hypothetical protein